MKTWLRVLVSLGCLFGTTVTPLSAQTPAVRSDKLAFDMRQETAGLAFLIAVDGTRQPLSGVTCGPLSNGISECQAPLPAMSPGAHRLIVIATATVAGATIESGPSNELQISFVAIVTPEGLRLIKG